MRRRHALTSSEQWDLGLMMALVMVALLVAAVLWRTHAIPHLLAMAYRSRTLHSTPALAPGPIAPDTDQPSLQNIGTPIFLPDAPEPAILDITPRVKPVETRWFKGKEYRYVKTLRMRVTGYSADARCCWPYDGTTTASGASVKTNAGKLVAADTSIVPFHDLVSVSGYNGGQPVPVLDRGGAIKGQRLDVLLPSFDQAKAWGARMIDVKIYAPVEP